MFSHVSGTFADVIYLFGYDGERRVVEAHKKTVKGIQYTLVAYYNYMGKEDGKYVYRLSSMDMNDIVEDD